MINDVASKFSGLSVLVVGDHCLDRNCIGHYEGYSREKEELPIFRIEKEIYNPGGAGNLASCFRSLGVNTTVAGIWGGNGDTNQRILNREFTHRGIDVSGMVTGSHTPTFEKYYFNSGKHMSRTDLVSEEIFPIIRQKFLLRLKQLLGRHYDLIAVASYDEVNEGICVNEVLDLISKQDAIPTFGTSRNRITVLDRLTYTIINENELYYFFGEGELNNIAERMLSYRTPVTKGLIVTRAEKGARVFLPGKPGEDFLAIPVRAVDTCGCGDAFLATFATCLTAGGTMAESINLALAAASIVVTKLYGIYNPTMDEVMRVYEYLSI